MKIKLNPKILVLPLVLGIIFAGILSSYSYLIIAQNYKISSLTAEEQNLNEEIENLTNQIPSFREQATNFTAAYLALGFKANLTTSLQGKEIVTSNYAATQSIPYNYFYVSGTVSNAGNGTAFQAGLRVVAYSYNGTQEIDMTLPLGGIFGTDSRINDYITNSYGGLGTSLQLGNLGSGQTVTTNIQIFHEGTVSNWTITPVWTNTP